MVYLAVTGAMAISNAWYGMEFMAAYGLGTMPALLFLSFAGLIISLRSRNFIRRLTPYAFLVMGALLVLRGLNLGIPFISPSFATNSASIICH
jgi:sulfite exporter TauE/SafE